MQIGGKEFELGDRVILEKAYALAHYRYGLTGMTNSEFSGITGTIIETASKDPLAVAALQVDPDFAKNIKNGILTLWRDDQLRSLDCAI